MSNSNHGTPQLLQSTSPISSTNLSIVNSGFLSLLHQIMTNYSQASSGSSCTKKLISNCICLLHIILKQKVPLKGLPRLWSKPFNTMSITTIPTVLTISSISKSLWITPSMQQGWKHPQNWSTRYHSACSPQLTLVQMTLQFLLYQITFSAFRSQLQRLETSTQLQRHLKQYMPTNAVVRNQSTRWETGFISILNIFVSQSAEGLQCQVLSPLHWTIQDYQDCSQNIKLQIWITFRIM